MGRPRSCRGSREKWRGRLSSCRGPAVGGGLDPRNDSPTNLFGVKTRKRREYFCGASAVSVQPVTVLVFKNKGNRLFWSRRRKPVAEDGSDSLESSQSCVDLSDLAIVVSSWEDALELLGCTAFTAAAAAALILLGNVIVAEASTSPSAFVQNVIYSTRLPSSPIPIARIGIGNS
ncbi:hypothetical protein Pyn_03391 [Prunus yedoensis var. nudiflora]|uniref:Uncharacterized protein n=1 Tax=Prunus yedoensis var. nudiflora TaxID=2094558 RepID=A0A314YN29_PRUYE|nr:hypothetical protein Pyn_03391 [Prunus yedoensis var. nudiflora]